MGAEDFAIFGQILGLQTRPKLNQNHRFSYIDYIPGLGGFRPVAQECDLYTKTYDFG